MAFEQDMASLCQFSAWWPSLQLNAHPSPCRGHCLEPSSPIKSYARDPDPGNPPRVTYPEARERQDCRRGSEEDLQTVQKGPEMVQESSKTALGGLKTPHKAFKLTS